MLIEGLSQVMSKSLKLVSQCREAVSFYTYHIYPHDMCQIILSQHKIAARGGHLCAQPLMEYLPISYCVRFSIAPYNCFKDIHSAFVGGCSKCE